VSSDNEPRVRSMRLVVSVHVHCSWESGKAMHNLPTAIRLVTGKVWGSTIFSKKNYLLKLKSRYIEILDIFQDDSIYWYKIYIAIFVYIDPSLLQQCDHWLWCSHMSMHLLYAVDIWCDISVEQFVVTEQGLRLNDCSTQLSKAYWYCSVLVIKF